MLTYYITDRLLFSGDEHARREQLLRAAADASAAGVDYIQLREKDLSPRALESLARQVLRAVRENGTSRLLVNHRADVALAVGADGVHLTGQDISAAEARAIATTFGRQNFLVGVSCRSPQEVRRAESDGASFAVLAPIFEKASAGLPGIGLEALRAAVPALLHSANAVEAHDTRPPFTLFALGGLTLERAAFCAKAGAGGVAGIRLFQQCDALAATVRRLHSL